MYAEKVPLQPTCFLNACTLNWQLISTAHAQCASDSTAHDQLLSPVDENIPFQALFNNIGEKLAF
jgi:hypothetical protein